MNDYELHADIVMLVNRYRWDARHTQRTMIQSIRRVRKSGLKSSPYFMRDYANTVQTVTTCDLWMKRNDS